MPWPLATIVDSTLAPYLPGESSLAMIEIATPKVLNETNDVYDLGAQGYWNSQEYYQTQYRVIQSRPVAEKVVATLGILPTALTEALRAQGVESVEAKVAGDPLLGLPEPLRHKLALVGVDGRDSTQAMLDALEGVDPVAQIQHRIDVEPVKDSRLVEVAVLDTDPERAALRFFFQVNTDNDSKYDEAMYTLVITDCSVTVSGNSRHVMASTAALWEGQHGTEPVLSGVAITVDLTITTP